MSEALGAPRVGLASMLTVPPGTDALALRLAGAAPLLRGETEAEGVGDSGGGGETDGRGVVEREGWAASERIAAPLAVPN